MLNGGFARNTLSYNSVTDFCVLQRVGKYATSIKMLHSKVFVLLCSDRYECSFGRLSTALGWTETLPQLNGSRFSP